MLISPKKNSLYKHNPILKFSIPAHAQRVHTIYLQYRYLSTYYLALSVWKNPLPGCAGLNWLACPCVGGEPGCPAGWADAEHLRHHQAGDPGHCHLCWASYCLLGHRLDIAVVWGFDLISFAEPVLFLAGSGFLNPGSDSANFLLYRYFASEACFRNVKV